MHGLHTRLIRRSSSDQERRWIMSRICVGLRHTWNIFSSQEQARLTSPQTAYYGASAGRKPDRTWYRVNLERSIVSSIYTRIAIDGASIAMRHVRLDDQD